MLADNYITMTDTQCCPFYDHCENSGTDVCKWDCPRCDGFNYMMCTSNLPKKLKRKQNLNFDFVQNSNARNYLYYSITHMEDFVNTGQQVLLYGMPGVGKTCWAVKMLSNYFALVAMHKHPGKFIRGLFINVPDLFVRLKYNMNKHNEDFDDLIAHIRTVPLVVWDDIFQTDPTSYESQCLYSYINERQNNELANIFTSNSTPDEIRMFDFRLHSRICTGADCIEIQSTDNRMNRVGFKQLAEEYFKDSDNNITE